MDVEVLMMLDMGVIETSHFIATLPGTMNTMADKELRMFKDSSNRKQRAGEIHKLKTRSHCSLP